MQRLIEFRKYEANRGCFDVDVITGHSITAWTRLCPFLTAYLNVDSFKLKVDKIRHFWTTYPPYPVNRVCERPQSLTWTSKLVQSKTGTFSYFDKMKCVAFQFNNSFKILLAHIHRVELILSNFMNNGMNFDIRRNE